MTNHTPDASQIVTHIQCELYDVMTPTNKEESIDNYRLLREQGYVVAAQLTMDVSNNEGFTPALSFISPLVPAATNFTGSIAGQISAVQHKNFTQSFTIRLDPTEFEKRTDELDEYCGRDKWTSYGLRGDLGLANIIEAGLYHSNRDQFLFPIPPSPSDAEIKAGMPSETLRLLNEIKDAKAGATTEPVFGATIEFTLVYGVTAAGPTWTLVRFKGPGSGNSGLLNGTRTIKDTLVISFAPTRPDLGIGYSRSTVAQDRAKNPHGGNIAKQPPVIPAEPTSEQIRQAADAASENNSRMILQGIPGTTP
ncbi:MAG TPA: hypothetical protein VGI95_03995 [Caulobacteraceae bacterium]|jgi:hypothetical protein